MVIKKSFLILIYDVKVSGRLMFIQILAKFNHHANTLILNIIRGEQGFIYNYNIKMSA